MGSFRLPPKNEEMKVIFREISTNLLLGRRVLVHLFGTNLDNEPMDGQPLLRILSPNLRSDIDQQKRQGQLVKYKNTFLSVEESTNLNQIRLDTESLSLSCRSPVLYGIATKGSI